MKNLSQVSEEHSQGPVRESKPLAETNYAAAKIRNTALGAASGAMTGFVFGPAGQKNDKNAVYANPKDKPSNIPSKAISAGAGAIIGGAMGFFGTKKRK